MPVKISSLWPQGERAIITVFSRDARSDSRLKAMTVIVWNSWAGATDTDMLTATLGGICTHLPLKPPADSWVSICPRMEQCAPVLPQDILERAWCLRSGLRAAGWSVLRSLGLVLALAFALASFARRFGLWGWLAFQCQRLLLRTLTTRRSRALVSESHEFFAK